MINRRTFENANIYTYGSWTSQTLSNSTNGMPTGVTSEWGYLSWDQDNIGTGYTGTMRIDILDSSGNVLIADIVKNSDGSPTDLSATAAASSDIKVRDRLYGLDYPTPRVYNLRLNFKNTNATQLVTNTGKDLMLGRTLSTTQSNVDSLVFGNGQTSVSESTTALTNTVSSPLDFVSTVGFTLTYNTDDATVEIAYDLSDKSVVSGTTINAIAFQNSDATPVFHSIAYFADIVKASTSIYHIKARFKIFEDGVASDHKATTTGKYFFIDRAFQTSPTLTPVATFVAGEETTLSASMAGLTTTNFGPTAVLSSTLNTVNHKITHIFQINQTEGNGYNYTAMGLYNSDGSPVFLYGALFGEVMQKSNVYAYQYNVEITALTPPGGYIL